MKSYIGYNGPRGMTLDDNIYVVMKTIENNLVEVDREK